MSDFLSGTFHPSQMRVDKWNINFDDAGGPSVEATTWRHNLDLPQDKLVLVHDVWLVKGVDWVHSANKRVWAMVTLSGGGRCCELMLPQLLTTGGDDQLLGMDAPANITTGIEGFASNVRQVSGCLLKPINNAAVGQVVFGDFDGGVDGIFVPEDCLITDFNVMHIGTGTLSGAGKLTVEAMVGDIHDGPTSDSADTGNTSPVGTLGAWDPAQSEFALPAVTLVDGDRFVSKACAGFVPAGSFLTVRSTHSDAALNPDTSDVHVTMTLVPLAGRGLALQRGPVPMGLIDTGNTRDAQLILTLEDGEAGSQLHNPLGDSLTAGGLSLWMRYQVLDLQV